MNKKRLSASEQYEVAKIKRKAWTIGSIAVAISLLLGGFIGGKIIKDLYKKFDDPNIQKLVDIYDIMIDEWYYGDEEFYDHMIDNAIDNMIESSDPYTFYTAKDESQNLTTTQKGLGFKYIYYGGNYYVSEVYHNSDAGAKGLKIGDVIIASKVNNEWKTLKNLSYQDALNSLVAEKDTVTYKLLRNHLEEEISFSRGNYQLVGASEVHSAVEDNKLIVAIKIDTFLTNPNISNNYDSLRVKVQDIIDNCLDKYNKTTVSQLTFDVRGNGGGHVLEAVNLASLFVEKGTNVMSYRYKNGNIDRLETTHNKVYDIQKMYILQDGGSASASESFTLAMKELCAAKVVGKTSYGKGIAQSVKEYSDGSAIRYTFAEVLSPNGNCIQGIGIEPDVDLKYPYYYFGEWGTLDEKYTRIVLDSFGFVMDKTYDDLSIAITEFQTEFDLELTASLNIETAQLLQKLSFDKYLTIIEKYNTTYIGE